MKLCIFVLLAAVIVGLAGCAVPQDQNTPNHQQVIREPITGRAYYLYVSSKYDASRPAPLIVSLQGTWPYDSAGGQVKEWKKLAEDYGAVLLCPTLKSSDGILTGGDEGLLLRLLADEQFVLTVIGQMHYKFNIDRRNIFLTCWSGGGYPLYFIGLRHPDLFAALVARQATFRQGVIEGWFPLAARNMPVLIFHGTGDFGAVQNDCKQAYDFLRGQGFKDVYLTTTPGGHVRRPEVAMAFFEQYWTYGPYVRGPVLPPAGPQSPGGTQ